MARRPLCSRRGAFIADGQDDEGAVASRDVAKAQHFGGRDLKLRAFADPAHHGLAAAGHSRTLQELGHVAE